MEFDRDLRDYDLLELRGEGAQGKVYKAKIKTTGQIIALKVIKVKEDEINVTIEELTSLEIISTPQCHPFLSCYYGHYYDPFNDLLLIEMEYIDGEDLYEWAKKFTNKTSLYHKLILLMADLSRALIFVHEKGIIHRDIKPANILITKEGVPKLVDFGLSCYTKVCSSKKCCDGRVGTPVFMAPETILYNKNYFTTDSWLLGATIFKLATDLYCYDFKDEDDIQSVLQTIARRDPKKLDTSNSVLNYIVNSCLVKDPSMRITAEKISNISNKCCPKINRDLIF